MQKKRPTLPRLRHLPTLDIGKPDFIREAILKEGYKLEPTSLFGYAIPYENMCGVMKKKLQERDEIFALPVIGFFHRNRFYRRLKSYENKFFHNS
jgi:hypothetical protein